MYRVPAKPSPVLSKRRGLAATALALGALVLAACGADEPRSVAGATGGTVSVAAAPPSAARASPTPLATIVANRTRAAGAPASGAVLGSTQFVHDGFRTQVAAKLSIGEALAGAGAPGEALIVALRNLSEPSGTLQTRATINFARGLDNFVRIPTVGGTLVLHLHRDGTLRAAPDNGTFT